MPLLADLPVCPFCRQAPRVTNHNIYVKCSNNSCPLHTVDFLLDEWRRLTVTAPAYQPDEFNQTLREKHYRECMDIVTKCSVRDPAPGSNIYVIPTNLVLQELEKGISR